MPSQARMHQTKSQRDAGPSFPEQQNIKRLPSEFTSGGAQTRTKPRQNSFDFVADMAARGPDTSSDSTQSAQLSSATPRPPAKVALSESPRGRVGSNSELSPRKTTSKKPTAFKAEVIELRNLPVFLYGSTGELSLPPTARLAGK
ncbi:hypothetical protein NU195Hw_Modified_25t1 [Hortaea werneckii]